MMRSGASEQLLAHLSKNDTLRLRNVQGMSDSSGKYTWSEWLEAEKKPTLPPGWNPDQAAATAGGGASARRRSASVSLLKPKPVEEWSAVI